MSPGLSRRAFVARPRGRSRVSATLLLPLLAACGGGAAYRVTELGPLPAVRSHAAFASAVNDRNQVVGYVREGTRGPRHAVLWEPDGRVVDLVAGAAWDINDAGVVVGEDATAGLRAFVWAAGRFRPISIPGATLSQAIAIGADGDVAGRYDVAGAPASQSRTFAWNNGVTRDLGPYQGGASSGFGVEKHGQVVGARLADPADPRSPNHAFFWYDGVARDLGTLPGGDFSTATDLVVSAWPPDEEETRFTIIGDSDVGPGPIVANVHGWIYTRHRMRDMRTLPGFPRVLPAALNHRGVAVGTMESADRFTQHAFLYSGVLLDLNTLIPEDSGWVLQGATDINDAGCIVGWGTVRGEQRAFLLTPR